MTLLKLGDRLSKSLMVMAALWAFFLCFLILGDAIGRRLLNAPIHGVREVVANSIVMIVFLQTAYAIRARSMLRADFILDLFGPTMRRIALAVCYLLGIAFFAVIAVRGIDPAIHDWVTGAFEGEGARRVPTWPTRFTIVIGATLAALNYLALFVIDVLRLGGDEGVDSAPGPTH